MNKDNRQPICNYAMIATEANPIMIPLSLGIANNVMIYHNDVFPSTVTASNSTCRLSISRVSEVNT